MQGLKNLFDEAIKIVLNSSKANLVNLKLEKSIQKHRDLGKLKKAVADEDFDVNHQSKNGSLLHVAAQANNVKAIQILLQSEEIDPNLKSKKDGSTPLMVACAAGNINSVEALLDCSEIDLSARNSSNQTAEQIVESAPVDEDINKTMQTLIKKFRSKQGGDKEEPIEGNASFLEDSINSPQKCTTTNKTGQSKSSCNVV